MCVFCSSSLLFLIWSVVSECVSEQLGLSDNLATLLTEQRGSLEEKKSERMEGTVSVISLKGDFEQKSSTHHELTGLSTRGQKDQSSPPDDGMSISPTQSSPVQSSLV